MKLNITKGENFKVGRTAIREFFNIESNEKGVIARTFSGGFDSIITEVEAEANAELFADAGTTANKCGLLPSELLKQRDELLSFLVDFVQYWNTPQSRVKSLQEHINHSLEMAQQTINNATNY